LGFHVYHYGILGVTHHVVFRYYNSGRSMDRAKDYTLCKIHMDETQKQIDHSTRDGRNPQEPDRSEPNYQTNSGSKNQLPMFL